MNFYVTPLDSSCTLVLGYHWLNQYNPLIDWVHNRITFHTNTPNEPPTVPLPKNPELALPKASPADQMKPGVTPRVTLINAKAFRCESSMQGSQCFRLQVATPEATGRSVSWFVPQSSISLQTLAPASNGSTHFRRFWIDLRPHWVVSLLLILSHGLLYVSVILLYLIFSILLDYILTSDLHP